MKRIFFLLLSILCLASLAACGKDAESDHVHAYEPSVIPPSCESAGYTEYRCACGDHHHSDPTAPTGHRMTVTSPEAACDTYTQLVSTCSVCGKSTTEITDQKGTLHSMKTTVVYPTRETGGYTLHACRRCEYSYQDSLTNPVTYSTGLTYEKRSDGYYVTGIGSCRDTEIAVPAVSEQGYKVVGIATNAFRKLSITSLTVENGVQILEDSAISECPSLTTVTLPPSIKEAEDALYALPSLNTLTLTPTRPLVTYFEGESDERFQKVEFSISEFPYIGKGTLPLSLKTVHIVGSACDMALRGCSMVETVTVDERIQSLPNMLFSGCTSLTNVSFSDHLTSIGASAFSGCSSLSELLLPNTVTSMGDYALSGMKITEMVLPEKLTKLPMGLFSGCDRLEQVNIPTGVTRIGDHVFKDCAALRSVEIPNGVTSLGYGVFLQSGLTSIRLPDSITDMSAVGIFSDCASLESVTLPTKLTSLGNYTFERCAALQSVLLPETLLTIGKEAFAESGITSIQLPSTLTSIGEKAFENCDGLKSVQIPESVKTMGAGTFLNCDLLSEVIFLGIELPDASSPFAGVPLLKTVQLSEGLTKIPHSFFANCIALETITVPSTVTQIGSQAFYGCTSLHTVDLSGAAITYGDGTATWNSYVFSGCTSLQTVLNDENVVQSYDETVFENTPLQSNKDGFCIGNGLLIKVYPNFPFDPTTVTVPETVRFVRDTAFYQCGNLTEIIFSEGTVSIGRAAFSECYNLTRVVLPDSLQSLHEKAFQSSDVTEIEIGSAVSLLTQTTLPSSLKVIRFRGTTEEWTKLFPVFPTAFDGISVICSDGSVT